MSDIKLTPAQKREFVSNWCPACNCHDCPLNDLECGGDGKTEEELDKMIRIIEESGITEMSHGYATVEEFLKHQKPTPVQPETVNHPNHYQGEHECIDVMRAMFGDEAVKGFCRCNAYKYRFRADQKNGEEDLRKARWYEDYLIKMEAEHEDRR